MFTEKKLLRDFDFFKKEDIALKKEYHHSQKDFIITSSFMGFCLILVSIFYPIIQEKNKTKIINEIRQEQSNEVLKNKDFYSLGISFLDYSIDDEITPEKRDKLIKENFSTFQFKNTKEKLQALLKINMNKDLITSPFNGNVNVTSKVTKFNEDEHFATFEIEKIYQNKNNESYKMLEVKIFDKQLLEQQGITKYIFEK